MAKILICDPVSDKCKKKLEDAGHELTENVGMDLDTLAEVAPDYHAAVVRSATKFRAKAIDACVEKGNMKLIVRGGVGLDNIDVDYAESKGISVRNTPAASSQSVAELAIGHMFGLCRYIPMATMTMKNGEWNKKKYKGIELDGKTLGVIGIGRIGQEVAKRANALGMTVIAFDKYIKESPMEEVKMVEFDELLAQSDFITLHIPFIKEEGPTLSTDEFAKMKDGVYIVNCARGGVVDEAALLDALNSGKVGKAAIDVFEEEPPGASDLVKHDKVYCTPHIGASTKEAQDRVGLEVADIIIDFFK